MRKGHEQMWTLSLEWRSFPLSPCSWLWEKHKTLWRFETNHLEWETENQKPQQKRRVCKEFVRTTGVDYCVSRKWKNHLRCWKGGVSFWMWPMEEIKSKSYQRFVNLNTLLNVAEYWKKTKHKTYFKFASSVQFSSVQLLSCVRLFETSWIAALQASLSITNSRSSLKIMSIESVMPSSHLILCHPSLPAPNPFQHQSPFQWVNSLHEVAKVLEF